MPGPGNPSKLKPAQKGEVRNPKGRPKGSRDRASVLRELLAIPINVKRPDGSTIPGATLEDAVWMALVQKALKGDVSAIKEVADTLHGKQQSAIDLTSGGEKLNAPAYDFSNMSEDQIRQLRDLQRLALPDASASE